MSNLQVSDWVTLLSMNEARKLEKERMREGVSLFILNTNQERITNEENWCVVTNKVPVTILGVELDSKPTRIPSCVSTTTLSTYTHATHHISHTHTSHTNCREADKQVSLLSDLREEFSFAIFGNIVSHFKDAISSYKQNKVAISNYYYFMSPVIMLNYIMKR